MMSSILIELVPNLLSKHLFQQQTTDNLLKNMFMTVRKKKACTVIITVFGKLTPNRILGTFGLHHSIDRAFLLTYTNCRQIYSFRSQEKKTF